MTIDIPNIDKTYSGIEFAYEAEGKFNQRYTADCIEYGDRFYTDFYAPKSYKAETLQQIGRDLALGWGGECIEVYRVVNKDGNLKLEKIST